MKIFKKVLMLFIFSSIAITILTGSVSKSIGINSNEINKMPIKVAVFLYRANDNYISEVKKSLEDIQEENQGKVEFNFFDGEGNQSIQNQSINKAIDEKYDLFIINLVDTKVGSIEDILNEVARKNIPFIIQGIATSDIVNYIKANYHTVLIASDAEQSGILEGKIIVDSWKANKETIDKNKDNVLQYIMLHGKANNPAAVDRTKYSLLTINDAGIKTENLVLRFCDWDKECARTNVESLFLNYGEKIEAIISNNDAMAIGAIEALQKYGYNKGDKGKNILVVGIDALPEARELVNKGFMTGTVIQNPRAEADALYNVGLNLFYGRDPLSGTNYKFDNTGIIIRLPYEEYIKP